MKYYRIKKNNDFQKIFKVGKRGFASTLSILYSPSEKLRMGICVSKKHGGSVVRNRVKRLLREVFRLHEDEIEQKCNYVLLPKVSDKYDFHVFEKEFLYLIKKNKLYRK